MNAETAPPLLEIAGLSVTFANDTGDLFTAVCNLDLRLSEGETLAVVGESGSGKSVTAMAITRLIDNAGGRIASGGIRFRDRHGKVRDLARESASRMRRLRGPEIAMVYQDALSSLNPSVLVGTQLEQLTSRGGTKTPTELLELVGLAPERTLRSYPHELSGGQRQRIAIARALMMNPKLLVLDEPVSALDLSVQAQVLNLLADLQDEFNLTYVFISHDLSVVRYIADEVMVMYFGEAVEYGTREEVFSAPKHEYTQTLFKATPRADVESIRARIAKKKAASAA